MTQPESPPEPPKQDAVARDVSLRQGYLDRALAQIGRLLGAVDRNPYRPTFGCFDREFWHYRTAGFPSEMHQEGVLPLALAYSLPLPGNPWHGNRRVGELAAAGIRFAAQSCHADGSCDDYYPFERAMGAAAFSFQAATAAYQILGLDDPAIVAWLRRRADWLARHDESGRLTNHHALAALGLLRLARITGEPTWRREADAKIDTVLSWQSDEGWFDEYGGADPGYQTVTIDCLAKYRQAAGDSRLDGPLRKAVEFARHFLHPDSSYAGEYGSRGTYHYYPHGFELLAGELPEAAELADGFLESLAQGTHAQFEDDRLFIHQLGNLLEAYRDWSPRRAVAMRPERKNERTSIYFAKAQLFVRRDAQEHTVVSAARGGVFKHFSPGRREPVTDAGLIVETTDGRVAVSQWHGQRPSTTQDLMETDSSEVRLTVTGPLHEARFETMTPWKQILLHVVMLTLGRWARGWVRRMLQRRLITGRRPRGIRLTRCFEFNKSEERGDSVLRVTDTIELTDPKLTVRRMALGVDHQAAYVAASNVYQPSVLASWTDLAEHVESLNGDRRVVIVREF